jgi:hypothetical protein
MNFSHATFLTVVLRMVCSSVLILVLTTLPLDVSALNSPQRPAVLSLAKSTAEFNPGPGHYRGPRTYLAMLGPAPLRFAEGQLQLPPEPVPPAPPKPKEPAIAATPTQTQSTPTPVVTTELIAKPIANTPEDTELNGIQPHSTLKPVSILPDDTKREIHAEDVLPFFQFPGAPDSVGIAVPFSTSQPRGTTAPPSSATYNQQ